VELDRVTFVWLVARTVRIYVPLAVVVTLSVEEPDVAVLDRLICVGLKV